MNWIGLIVIIIVVIALIILLVAWMRKNNPNPPPPSGSVFYLNYNDVVPPLVGVFNGQLVKPEINPNDMLRMYTNAYQVAQGDILQLEETNSGIVIQSKTIEFNTTTGVGDWSLLFNLREQLAADGFMNSSYTLALVRNGTRIISKVLGANIVEIEWFSSDVRNLYPNLKNAPLVFLGDLLFVATVQPNGDRILEYLYYCSDDRNATFTIHEASPKTDAFQTATLTTLKERYSRHFVGLTNYEVEEITYWEPQPPTPPTTPIVIDSSKPYPATYKGIPPATDVNILDMSTDTVTVQNGDTVQISRGGVIYYQLKNVQLDNLSPTELSNDYKWLFSGLYSLIEQNYLRTGDFTIQIVKDTGVALSRLIPANVTGVKMFPDKRIPTTGISNSAIISDVAQIQPYDNTTAAFYKTFPTDLWWCVDGTMQTYSNGSFTGILKDIVSYYKQQDSTVQGIKVKLCDYIDPTIFMEIST